MSIRRRKAGARPLRRVRRTLAFGNYGRRNMGDEATLEALHDALLRRRPDIELVALSFDPLDTERRHGLPARSVRPEGGDDGPPPPREPGFRRVRAALAPMPGAEAAAARLLGVARTGLAVAREPVHFARCLRVMDGVDVLLFSGGGPACDDFGGPWSLPYQLAKLSLAARLRRARVAFVSVGAGPLDHVLSRAFVRFAVSLADYRSFRDQASLDLIRSIGCHGELLLVPDLAFGLRWDEAARGAPRNGAARIGLSPYPFQDRRYMLAGTAERYDEYLDSTAELVAGLLRAGHDVTFVPTQLRIDTLVGDELEREIARRAGAEALARLHRPRIAGTGDVRAALSSVDAMLVTRFHGILLSFVVGTPVLGLCCHLKMDSLMLEAGQWRHRIPLDECDAARMSEGLANLLADSQRVSRELADRVASSRASLDAQLDRLFGPPAP